MKTLVALSALAIANLIGASVITGVKAQTANTTSAFDLKDISCRELMLSDSENRELMMSLFHGFMNGRKNETQLDPNQLAKATDDIQNYCVDNPKAALLEVFEKYRQ